MAEATKQEEFRDQQKQEAKAQNLTSENAVPEKRPQAFTENPNTESDLTERLKEEGALVGYEPMPKEAFDRAEKNAKSKKKSSGLRPAAHVGTVVEVLDGPHRGRFGAVTRVLSYNSVEDHQKATSGEAIQDFVPPKEVAVTFVGDARDGERTVLDLSDIEYKVHQDGAFAGRSRVG